MREKIIAGNFYHVLSRGVDKRTIFMENKDYLRFIHDLFEFNDINPVLNINYLFNKKHSIEASSPGVKRAPRKLLVEILAFCLMPNHFHLMIRPKQDGALTQFMKKLNIGYAKYFNEKYQRSGALFEGRFKSVAITQDAHFSYLPYYIHLNPLDLVSPEWREWKLKDFSKAMEFLSSYRWSSHLDYCGKKNFPSVTQREFLLDFFGGYEKYARGVENWLGDLKQTSPLMRSAILEK
jgi:putative transposase